MKRRKSDKPDKPDKPDEAEDDDDGTYAYQLSKFDKAFVAVVAVFGCWVAHSVLSGGFLEGFVEKLARTYTEVRSTLQFWGLIGIAGFVLHHACRLICSTMAWRASTRQTDAERARYETETDALKAEIERQREETKRLEALRVAGDLAHNQASIQQLSNIVQTTNCGPALARIAIQAQPVTQLAVAVADMQYAQDREQQERLPPGSMLHRLQQLQAPPPAPPAQTGPPPALPAQTGPPPAPPAQTGPTVPYWQQAEDFLRDNQF